MEVNSELDIRARSTAHWPATKLWRGNVRRHSGSVLARVLRIGAVGCVLTGAGVLPARVAAQVSSAEEAQGYINEHADIEDMVMVPMRDGVRLYHVILFPKGQPRQNMPTVLIRIPYWIDAHHLSFPQFVASFLAHG